VSDDDFAEFLEIFLEESLERLVNVSKSLETLQDGGDAAAALEEVDRELHTIKGSSRLLGFTRLGGLVHDIEGLALRSRAEPNPELLELLVEAADRLAVLVEGVGQTQADQTDEELQLRVQATLGAAPYEDADSPPDARDDAGRVATESAAPVEERPPAVVPEGAAPDVVEDPPQPVELDEEMQEFLEIFLEESLERLVNVSKSLEQLQEGFDAGALEEVDRELHTIKGSARLLGFNRLGSLVHEVEGLAGAYRLAPSASLLELLTEASDRLSTLVETAGRDSLDSGDAALQARITASLGGAAQDPGETDPNKSETARWKAELDPTRHAPPTGVQRPAGEPPHGDEEPAQDPAQDPMLEELGAPTTLMDAALDGPTSSTDLGPDPERTAPFDRRARTDQPTGGTKSTSSFPRGPKGAATGATGEDEYVRVRASRLADLDGITSELSLTRLRLEAYEDQLSRLLRSVREGTADAPAVTQSLRTMLHEYRGDSLRVHRAAQRLQRLAVDVRLRPVEHLFDHIPREARGLARSLDKQVKVRIYGADTEIDRVILDNLRSPLGHLIRNAIDHGIEKPAVRESKGKAPQGLLEVSAGHEGGQVLITIDDDGQGIDPAHIKARAVTRGVIDSDTAADMTEEEAIQLIFVPGFSTRETATHTSGRGVGMDVVRKAVDSLGGDIRVQSGKNRGTRMIIRLPLTLLISRVTFVRSSGQQFGVPTESLQESLRLSSSRVTVFDGRQATILSGRTVPIVRLGNVLGHRILPDGSYLNLLVLRHGDDLLALEVEEVLDERPVVVKPLGWPLERVTGFGGAVNLPSGEVALLLNVADLFTLTRRGAIQAVESPASSQRRKTILAVDDSIVARQLVSRYVQALGFDLLSAVDGMDALGILERVTPDLIVTDLEMPRLNGLGLARRVRADERFSAIPIIIISTRGSEVDRQAGLEAGADAYMTKSECNQESFRTVVERLL
jgi:two-component system, chemotaxis family, sensor kinase CheA